MLNCLIIDDEQHCIDVLKLHIKNTDILNLVKDTIDPIKGMHFLNNEQIDLVFIDVNMPQLSGIELVENYRGKAKFIMCTAYEQHAFDAFSLNIIDYCLKPINYARFTNAVNKAITVIEGEKRLLEQPPSVTKNSGAYTYFNVSMHNKKVKVFYDDIIYIEAANNYCNVYLEDERLLVYGNLKTVHETFDENTFLRVHNSYIINLNRLEYYQGNRLKLKGLKDELKISDSYKKKFYEFVENPLNK